jgi:tetratricopeptide (TPR) repeat protein
MLPRIGSFCQAVQSTPEMTAMTGIAKSLLLGAALLATSPLAAQAIADKTQAPLFEGTRAPTAPAATRNALAQRYFEQGVMLTWGFNPAEAARSFEAATRIDPRCSLCWWGIAWALGPSLNSDMASTDAPRVAAALRRALAVAGTPRERGLVRAMAARHPDPGGVGVDEAAYAERMLALARSFPDDADIAELAAESLIDLHPYDWWTAAGEPRPWTPEILRLLDRALSLDPRHPGAHHYRIHVLESSAHPERALASARALTTLVPGSGHLLHMPAHIFMRLGRYSEAIASSQAAISADARYLSQVDAQKAYRVGYVGHNQHFLWAAAAMSGRSALALAAARAAWPAACGPGPSDRSSAILQHYYVLPLYTQVRFGRWGEILQDTLPPDVDEPYPLAIWHYARGTAYARTGRLADARVELTKMEMLAGDPALERTRIKNVNPAKALVRIALVTLRADLAAAEHDTDAAVALLRQATEIEDTLAYDEPHLWLAPTRQALGAALLDARRPAEAEAVYRQDLRHYPDNPWSLAGLTEALRRQGRSDAVRATAQRLAQAARHADVSITRSRF